MRIAAALLVTAGLATLPQPAHAQIVVPSGQSQAQRHPVAQHCVACHGARGEGNPGAGGPRIAGQPQYYLAKQLESYADGSRRDPAMEAMAKLLSPEDRAAFAAYYAQLDAPTPGSAGGAPPPERGRVLATKGDEARRVQACINCHGPGGVGEPPIYPYLAGLDAGYLGTALNSWKNGTRRNDAGQQMLTIANALAPEDVVAVAQYYASLPPPRPSPFGMVQAARPMTVRDGDPGRGRALVASGVHGCPACHAIPGIRAPRGIVGPPLGGLAGRAFLAGQLPNNAGTLVAFLRNPPALVARTGMPDVGLTLEQARDIAAFLYSLERTGAP